MAGGMSSMNSAAGGLNLDPKQLSTEAVKTASEMKAVIDEFTAGMHGASAARYKATLGEYAKFEDLRAEIAKKSSMQRMKDELDHFKGTIEEKKQLEKELADEEKRVADLTVRAVASLRAHMYKNATANEKAEMRKKNAEAIKSDRIALKQKYEEEWAAAEGDGKKRAALTRKYRKETAASIKAERDERMASIKLQQSAVGRNLKNTNKDMNALLKHPNLKNVGKFALDLAVLGGKDLSKVIDGLKEVHKAAREELEAREDELADAREKYGEDSKEYKDAKKAVDEARKEKDIAAAMEAVADSVNKVKEAFDGAFKEAEDMMTQYMGKIDSRLQGSETSYKEAMGKISTNLSISPFVKSKAAVENMAKLVEQGIAYNLEQRAFLSTVSDKIASTFDAFDSNLARLIRLQQADTTAARLGMEAALTQFFNGMYQDTSYMTKGGVADSVSSMLIDASSTMTRNMSAEFEYVVHKWMGSLSSVGMSTEAINQIVTGINYLATGDVQSLANNTQIQTLLAMSAAKSGEEYSELLLKGLDAKKTNNLLAAMVSYLKDIAEGADNQVVRAAYGDVFNLSMSDMKAISNLRTSDIKSISNSNLSYNGMEQELTKQFSALITRTSISEMMSNIYDNAIFGIAEDLVSDPITYSMYKMLGFLKERDLDINIPSISVAGFGLDLETSVQGLMNLGIGLSSAFSLISNILGGLGSAGGMNLDAWGGTEYTQRGSGKSFSTEAVAGATSGSTFVASNSSDDMKKSSLSSATDDAEETSEITNKNSDPGKTMDDFYKATVNEGGKFLRVQDPRMTFSDNALRTRDDYLFKAFTTVFGTNSLLETGRIKVSSAFRDGDVFTAYKSSYADQVLTSTADAIDNDGLAVLQVYDSHAVSAIRDLNGLFSAVTISTIGESAAKTLTTAIADKITGSGGSGKSIDKLYKLFSDANGTDKAHIRIQNEDGKRLQVDTEAFTFDQTEQYDKSAYATGVSLDVGSIASAGIKW